VSRTSRHHHLLALLVHHEVTERLLVVLVLQEAPVLVLGRQLRVQTLAGLGPRRRQGVFLFLLLLFLLHVLPGLVPLSSRRTRLARRSRLLFRPDDGNALEYLPAALDLAGARLGVQERVAVARSGLGSGSDAGPARGGFGGGGGGGSSTREVLPPLRVIKDGEVGVLLGYGNENVNEELGLELVAE